MDQEPRTAAIITGLPEGYASAGYIVARGFQLVDASKRSGGPQPRWHQWKTDEQLYLVETTLNLVAAGAQLGAGVDQSLRDCLASAQRDIEHAALMSSGRIIGQQLKQQGDALRSRLDTMFPPVPEEQAAAADLGQTAVMQAKKAGLREAISKAFRGR
ncbi:MAG TPA: hypothetical protein VHB51_00545 [Candidatus Saccharimonadales bacterium]|nr:hypothetical protein [Candidatus Saccharimonadales bacterium]